MKTNEEMTAAVLERVRTEQAAAQRRKRQRAHTLATVVCCCAVLGLAGGAVYAVQTGRLRAMQPESVEQAEKTPAGQPEKVPSAEDVPVKGGAADSMAQPGGQTAGEVDVQQSAQTESTQPARTETGQPENDPIAPPNGQQSLLSENGDVSPADASETVEDVCHKVGDPYSPTPKIPMISDYDGPPLTTTRCVEPYNGSVMLSAALQDALVVHEGEVVLYRVRMTLYQDSLPLPDDGDDAQAEVQRLADAGYTVAQETFWDGQERHTTLSLHATEEQLRQFPGNASYGYRLSLYDEAPVA